MEVAKAFRSINEHVQTIESAVDLGATQPDHFDSDLFALAARIKRISDGATIVKKNGSGFRLRGLDRRKMRDALQISWAGLKWLIEHEHIPQPDCKVPSYEWRGCGKYAVDTVDEGWSPEVADKLVANGEALRQAYANRHN